MDFSLLRYKKEEVMDETYIGSFYINDNECYDLYYEKLYYGYLLFEKVRIIGEYQQLEKTYSAPIDKTDKNILYALIGI